MAKINLDKMTLKELLALDAEVESALNSARAKGKSEAKEKLAALAQQHGFSISELFGAGRGPGKQKSVGAAKYANPDDKSDTWTGRGRKPNWLLGRLKKGSKLEDFAI